MSAHSLHYSVFGVALSSARVLSAGRSRGSTNPNKVIGASLNALLGSMGLPVNGSLQGTIYQAHWLSLDLMQCSAASLEYFLGIAGGCLSLSMTGFTGLMGFFIWLRLQWGDVPFIEMVTFLLTI